MYLMYRHAKCWNAWMMFLGGGAASGGAWPSGKSRRGFSSCSCSLSSLMASAHMLLNVTFDMVRRPCAAVDSLCAPQRWFGVVRLAGRAVRYVHWQASRGILAFSAGHRAMQRAVGRRGTLDEILSSGRQAGLPLAAAPSSCRRALDCRRLSACRSVGVIVSGRTRRRQHCGPPVGQWCHAGAAPCRLGRNDGRAAAAAAPEQHARGPVGMTWQVVAQFILWNASNTISPTSRRLSSRLRDCRPPRAGPYGLGSPIR